MFWLRIISHSWIVGHSWVQLYLWRLEAFCHCLASLLCMTWISWCRNQTDQYTLAYPTQKTADVYNFGSWPIEYQVNQLCISAVRASYLNLARILIAVCCIPGHGLSRSELSRLDAQKIWEASLFSDTVFMSLVVDWRADMRCFEHIQFDTMITLPERRPTSSIARILMAWTHVPLRLVCIGPPPRDRLLLIILLVL